MQNDIIAKFTDHLKSVLTRALTLVVEKQGAHIEPIHLLWALSGQQGCIASDVLQKAGADAESLLLACNTKSTEEKTIPILSANSKRMIEKAVLIANIYEHRYVGTEHLLSAMIQVKSSSLASYFETFDIDTILINSTLNTILSTTSHFPNTNSALTAIEGGATIKEEEKVSDAPALEYFTEELTSKERAMTIDSVIGRDNEIERIIHILGRRTKNNPVLIGEPGVGKTAIVEGLAKRIFEKEVPPHLHRIKIHELSLTSLLAGTMYRGEFESRLRQLLEEIEDDEHVVLFIDEIHTLMGAGAASGSLDAANILKPALARGNVRCIGATTPAEFKKHIETDGAMERRFLPIRVHEPSKEETYQIVKGVLPYYEEHHNVTYEDDSIWSAIELTSTYISDKQFPDKAIDILDEVGSAIGDPIIEPDEERTEKLNIELKEIQTKKQEAAVKEQFQKAQEYKIRESEIKKELEKNTEPLIPPKKKIQKSHITHAIGRIIGKDITIANQNNLAQLCQALKKQIIGQDAVIDQVARAIIRAKLGFHDTNQPLTSLFFLGPSGVGKTALAQALATELFGSRQHFLRLDMGEFSAPFTVSKLFGSPAGYIGYREASKLTDYVKQYPHSIVLFDEIEKAHRDVHNAILQILDNGIITDATGRQINFRNTIIIFTSNTGSAVFEKGSLGFGENDQTESRIQTELKEQFSREFLNRIRHTCIFNPLSLEHREQIAVLLLDDLVNRLKHIGIVCKYSKSTAKKLATSSNAIYGAREIKRTLETMIEHRIADLILQSKTISGIRIKTKKDSIDIDRI